jgi:hypothetical protein
MSDAARNEVEQPDTIDVVWRGETLTLPASLDESPLEVLEAFELGHAVQAMRLILGGGQLDRLKLKLSLRVKDFGELADFVAQEMGFGNAGK